MPEGHVARSRSDVLLDAGGLQQVLHLLVAELAVGAANVRQRVLLGLRKLPGGGADALLQVARAEHGALLAEAEVALRAAQ